jgi:hypothetical protein
MRAAGASENHRAGDEKLHGELREQDIVTGIIKDPPLDGKHDNQIK